MEQTACETCRKLAEQIDQLTAQNLEMAEQNAEMAEEMSGLLLQIRREARSRAALERQLREAMENDPTSEDIREISEAWKRLLGHPRAKVPAGGKRWLVIKKALRDHTKEELIEALEGLSYVPFVGPKGRKPEGHAKERYDDVEHALRDETTIERFRGYRARATAASEWVVYDLWQAMCATTYVYERLLLDKLAERRQALGFKEEAA